MAFNIFPPFKASKYEVCLTLVTLKGLVSQSLKISGFFFMFSKRILTNDSQNFFLSFNFILWCFIQNRRLMDYLSKHKLVIIWNQWIFKPFFKVLTWKIDLSSKVLVIIHTFKKNTEGAISHIEICLPWIFWLILAVV